MSELCIGYIVDPSKGNTCSLLYQATEYNALQTSLNISDDVTALLRYDFHLARIKKALCNEVYALPNLATNGIASQSSYHVSASYNTSAEHAIDGRPGHRWYSLSCSQTHQEDDPWWLLDMKQEVDVAMVRISNREDWHQLLSNFEIRIGMDSTDFSQNALCFNMSEIAPSGVTTNFPCLNVIRGRYLSIQRYFPYSVQGKFLQFCEVQVIPKISDFSRYNIAPFGTAKQSSTAYEGYALRAIDGVTNSNYWLANSCTDTEASDSNAWWLLDLMQTTTVALVRLTSRDTGDWLYNFEIRIGFNDTDFTRNALCHYMPGLVGTGATEDFPCVTPTVGRYLSIQRLYPFSPSGGKYLDLCEVQVFQTGC